ncbi:MAG: hypothetical protein WBN23_10825 [Woeseia sp.]
MNKTFWLGYVAVFAAAQAIYFLVHEILLGPTYESLAAVFRPEAEMMSMMWVMLVGSAVSLLAFCYIFTKGYENRGIAEGVRYGVLIGLLYAVPYALDQYVIYPISTYLTHMWIISGVLIFAVLGAVFAAIYRPSR